MEGQNEAGNRVLVLLLADALEALIPMVDEWAGNVAAHPAGEHTLAYRRGYEAGVSRMAAEMKDQLVDRVLRLRQ
ncbi:MAG: hypothetical protein ACRDFS_09735 [Chloroflexota bacterium]